MSETSRIQGIQEFAPDLLDKKLLNLLQWDFPLVAKPFDAIGKGLQISEEQVVDRILKLKQSGIIRQVNAIFDTRRLGYKSSLVAMAIDESSIDTVANKISEHPGVSHNYKRDHEFNLWFTLAVPPDGNIQNEVKKLSALKGVIRCRLLPTQKLFKIGVKLDMLKDDPQNPTPDEDFKENSIPPVKLQERDIEIIREMQEDIEIISRPFEKMSERLGLREEDFLEKMKEFQDRGIMRRFAAILRHQKAGFKANGMITWKVPPERVEEVGMVAASFSQVSHCYQRPVYPDWQYNLFSMVHARSREGCEKIAEEISRRTGIQDYAILYSTKEYKKERVKYFT
ncbi:MAG: Lrp/AsnC family transcriptional regulator [Thaumarchaeota archaeon]|nr:Lrp/AsnC family transcriptional regulator [Nitrososphaerota archaeon]